MSVQGEVDTIYADGVYSLLFEEELLHAVRDEQFTLVYQPIFNLAQQFVGFEA